MAEPKYRLITRADFDGVVCWALFSELNMIDDIVFAEPNDMQQGRVPVSSKDISANLPYVEVFTSVSITTAVNLNGSVRRKT